MNFRSAHRRCLAAFVLMTMLFAIAPPPSRAAQAPPDPIDTAVEKAKKFIYSQQQPSGRWEHDPARVGTGHDAYHQMQGDSYGGFTALCTYALLAAGESPNEPRIKSAVEFLKHADMVGVYAVAMRLQVWLLIPHENTEIKALIHKDADFLLKGVNVAKDIPGSNYGLWDYLGKGERIDHSVSQYGVLGLWAAQQSGVVDVGTAHWKMFEAAWRRDQQSDGGWDYDQMGGSSLSMSAAGVATLFITADYLHAEDAIACVGELPDSWVDHGLAWIDAHYNDVEANTYVMYGIERIGAASGYRYFAAHDWFTDLSSRLVHTQKEDGSWDSIYPGASILDSTCFALLFLARGRAPVMFNKLDYRQRTSPAKAATPDNPTPSPQIIPANWNERPRDVANLATWAGHQTETFRNWQIVNLVIPADALHDAPVLYMSGNEAISLSPQDSAKLKLFIEQGGMVLGNADCGREAFSKSFEELGTKLFGGSFRELPPNHPAYTHQQFPASAWRVRPSVRGLSNGVRELMAVIPSADPARWWQNPNGSAGHEDAYQLGIDLYQYAIDRQLWNKGESFVIEPDPKVHATRRLKLARLKVGSNWDPEPGGWSRIGAILHNEDAIDLSVFPTLPGQGTLAAAKIAHLTGTEDFVLNDVARIELANFVKQGGTLLVDAAGGSQTFADAADRELRAIFGSAAESMNTPLPRTDSIYHVPGHEIATFSYRPWARVSGVGSLKEPRIRGIEVGGRIGVYFSREDLSAGLVGEPVDGVIGYSPETATDIVQNILLSVAPKPAPPPAAGK